MKKQMKNSYVNNNMNKELIEKYITQTLEQKKAPESVYLFAKSAGIEEKEFYNHFASLEGLENNIFSRWFLDTIEIQKSSEPWQAYSSREKALAVFFAFIENLKNYRSFVNFLHQRDSKMLPKWPSYLNQLHKDFVAELKPIIHEGLETKELAERKYVDDKYADGLWVNFVFIINFWLKDNSKGFEKTDEAIERSVNLAFDLMGKSALDAALDFGKFLFQNK
jgi:AcrR family transcriptional regulator